MSPFINIGDVSPLSHRDRRPWCHHHLSSFSAYFKENLVLYFLGIVVHGLLAVCGRASTGVQGQCHRAEGKAILKLKCFCVRIHSIFTLRVPIIGPIPWGHSGPLCHALSLSSALSWTSMRRRRATVYRERHLLNGREAARSGEWAQHFSNASCCCIWCTHCCLQMHCTSRHH